MGETIFPLIGNLDFKTLTSEQLKKVQQWEKVVGKAPEFGFVSPEAKPIVLTKNPPKNGNIEHRSSKSPSGEVSNKQNEKVSNKSKNKEIKKLDLKEHNKKENK